MTQDDDPQRQLAERWSPEIAGFMSHWRSLRQGNLMPTSEHYLDNPAPSIVPNSYIVEMTEAGAMVRFHGAELIQRWGRDFTGLEIHDGRMPKLTSRSLGNMRRVIEHPCGYVATLAFSTSTGRQMGSTIIQLPLAVNVGRPRRIVCFATMDSGQKWQETFARYLETHQVDWIDIGAGVPPEPPLGLLQNE